MQNWLWFSHVTCKSHGSADLTTGHLEIKTGFRHRPTRRFGFNSAYLNERLVFNGLLFIWGAFNKQQAKTAPVAC
jgi:hypothetical protein